MDLNNNITRRIFERKYPYEMSYMHYLHLLATGFKILNDTNIAIEACSDLNDLKAIRIALEYRLEVIRQVRKKQIKHAIGTIHNLEFSA